MVPRRAWSVFQFAPTLDRNGLWADAFVSLHPFLSYRTAQRALEGIRVQLWVFTRVSFRRSPAGGRALRHTRRLSRGSPVSRTPSCPRPGSHWAVPISIVEPFKNVLKGGSRCRRPWDGSSQFHSKPRVLGGVHILPPSLPSGVPAAGAGHRCRCAASCYPISGCTQRGPSSPAKGPLDCSRLCLQGEPLLASVLIFCTDEFPLSPVNTQQWSHELPSLPSFQSFSLLLGITLLAPVHRISCHVSLRKLYSWHFTFTSGAHLGWGFA